MKRNNLFYASCIATASKNISSLHSTTILTHTIACSHTFFSETKYCYSRSDVKSQLVPFSAIPRSWTWKRANLQTLKIHRKLTKMATTIIFSQWWSGEKGNLYQRKKSLGVSGTLTLSVVDSRYPINPINTHISILWFCISTDRSFSRKTLTAYRNKRCRIHIGSVVGPRILIHLI